MQNSLAKTVKTDAEKADVFLKYFSSVFTDDNKL